MTASELGAERAHMIPRAIMSRCLPSSFLLQRTEFLRLVSREIVSRSLTRNGSAPLINHPPEDPLKEGTLAEANLLE